MYRKEFGAGENKMDTNKCADGFMIYLSIHEAIIELGKTNPKDAFEYYQALANYNFYNEEYNGDNPMIKIMAKQQYPLIDNQRERYSKAVKGGRNKKDQIDWNELLEAAKSGQFQTLQSLGEHFGTSGQNIGKRLKYHNLKLADLIPKNQNKTGLERIKELEKEN